MEKVASSTSQLGLANCRGLWFVMGSSQMEMSVRMRNITLPRKSLCASLAYHYQVRFKKSVGTHKSINASRCVLQKRRKCVQG